MTERLMQRDGSANFPGVVTALLKRWSAGDPQAREELIPLVYEHLHELAHERLGQMPGAYSLNTTGLVHETYIKLVDVKQVDLPNRARFLALAARVMRNLLVDHARARRAEKRGAGQVPIEIEEVHWVADEDLESFAELHDALGRLERLNARQSELLQQRYFGGLSLEESASALGISLATAKRELRAARAWLALALNGESLG